MPLKITAAQVFIPAQLGCICRRNQDILIAVVIKITAE